MTKFLVELSIGGQMEVYATDKDNAIDLAMNILLNNGEWDEYVEEIEE